MTDSRHWLRSLSSLQGLSICTLLIRRMSKEQSKIPNPPLSLFLYIYIYVQPTTLRDLPLIIAVPRSDFVKDTDASSSHCRLLPPTPRLGYHHGPIYSDYLGFTWFKYVTVDKKTVLGLLLPSKTLLRVQLYTRFIQSRAALITTADLSV